MIVVVTTSAILEVAATAGMIAVVTGVGFAAAKIVGRITGTKRIGGDDEKSN